MECNCKRFDDAADIPITYWKLSCPSHSHLTRRASRAERGLMFYDGLPFETLQGFVASRQLSGAPAHKAALIILLKQADDERVFNRFMELPPELRVRIYEYHFASFDFVTAEPAPILTVCRQVRTEARPLFYESTRLRILIGYDFWSGVPHQRQGSGARLGRAGLCYRLFEELDITCLTRINKLTLKYVWAGTQYFDVDFLADKDELLVRRVSFDPVYGIERIKSVADHESEDTTETWAEPDAEVLHLRGIAKDIAARPGKQKLQRGDLLRFAAHGVRSTMLGR